MSRLPPLPPPFHLFYSYSAPSPSRHVHAPHKDHSREIRRAHCGVEQVAVARGHRPPLTAESQPREEALSVELPAHNALVLLASSHPLLALPSRSASPSAWSPRRVACPWFLPHQPPHSALPSQEGGLGRLRPKAAATGRSGMLMAVVPTLDRNHCGASRSHRSRHHTRCCRRQSCCRRTRPSRDRGRRRMTGWRQPHAPWSARRRLRAHQSQPPSRRGR